MGPAGPARPNERGFGPREKNSVSKRVGFGLWAKTRTRPVAIPSINGFVAVLTPKEASKLSSNKQKHHMDLFPIINLCFFFNLYLILKQWFQTELKEVVSVYQSNPRKYSLYTTRSWEFLGLEQGETKPIKANSYSGGKKKKGKAGRFHKLDLPIPQLF